MRVKDGMVGTYNVSAKRGSGFKEVAPSEEEKERKWHWAVRY